MQPTTVKGFGGIGACGGDRNDAARPSLGKEGSGESERRITPRDRKTFRFDSGEELDPAASEDPVGALPAESRIPMIGHRRVDTAVADARGVQGSPLGGRSPEDLLPPSGRRSEQVLDGRLKGPSQGESGTDIGNVATRLDGTYQLAGQTRHRGDVGLAEPEGGAPAADSFGHSSILAISQ